MAFDAWPFKDPDEVLDYQVDWTAALGDLDTLSASIWIVPTGINEDTNLFDDYVATIWLSGGTVGETYELTNRVTTQLGRTMDKTVKLKIKVK